jgi:HEAT repeat protein
VVDQETLFPATARERGPGRARLWVLLSAVLLLALTALSYSVVALARARQLARCREPAEGREASRRLTAFFAAHRDALSEGVLDPSGSDPAAIEGSLRMLLHILEDDTLLEAEVHRRPSAGRGLSVHSAHAWIVEASGAPSRARLARLLSHSAPSIRDQAARALSLLAWKVPEALAGEPLPYFRREHLRALLLVQGGEPPPAEVALLPFIREGLLAPGAFRLWALGAQPGAAAASGLFLRALLAEEAPLRGELAEALLAAPDLAGPDRLLQIRTLGRLVHPQAWRKLIRIAGGSEPLPARAEALQALRAAGPVEAIPELRELASRPTGAPLVAQVREALEHIAGARITEWPVSLPEPGRLEALRAACGPDVSAAGTLERGLSALRFHALHPQLSASDDQAAQALLLPLSSPSPEVRLGGARALGQVAVPEAPGRLIDLLADPDVRVAAAAAASLFDLTAFWPATEARVAERPGALPLEVAADPARLEAFAQGWKAWRAGAGGWNQRLAAALESGEPFRVAPAARRLQALASAGPGAGAGPPVPAERLLGSFGRASAPARAAILEALAERGDTEAIAPLRKLFEPAFRADPADAWEIVHAIHRLLVRKTAAADSAAVVDGLLDDLAARPGASAGVIARYIDSRFTASLVDERMALLLKRLAPPEGSLSQGGGAGALRAGLTRWYPRAPGRDRARTLVALLSDPEPLVRFWALEHLVELSGSSFGFDPAAPPAARAEALGPWRDWLERWRGPAGG